MDGNDEGRVLAVEQRGTVRYLTLDRPDVLNARHFSDDDEITRVAGEVEGRGRRSLAVSTDVTDDEAVHRSLEAVVGAEVTPLCFTRTAKHCRGRWSSRQAWASTNRFTKRPIEQYITRGTKGRGITRSENDGRRSACQAQQARG